jgi:hypothetical protein
MLHLDTVNAFDMKQQLGAVFIGIKSALHKVLADLIWRLKRPSPLSAFIYNIVYEKFPSYRFDTLDGTDGCTGDYWRVVSSDRA